MKNTFVIVLLLFAQLNFAQETRKNYTATTSEDLNITVNGIFDEPEWKLARWENNFIQHQPVEGAAPSQQTEFAVLYDANNIYVAIKALDKRPDSISMRMTRRDEIDGDLVGIFFDSYFDKRTAFGFIVSAAGVRSDFINSNDGNNEDDTWDPIWWVKTKVTDEGWNAEMRIPMTQLRFEESDEQQWGLQVFRMIFRHEELSSWQLMKRETAGFASQFGTLSGINNIRPQKTFDVTPYAVARTERFEKDENNPFLKSGRKNGFNAGLDAKIGLTNYLTMDLTINPDFGQVEADPSEVNLTTHETFFEEKRPFFIEGKNILTYGLSFGDGDLAANNLFYSRRIGRRPQGYADTGEGEYADTPEFTRILGAAKVTGKTKDGWSVGILESVTAAEHAEIKGIGDGREQTVEPLTNYFVSRVQKDFNEGNTYVGGMLTAVNRNINDEHLEFLHQSAYTGGLDFVHKWNNKDWLVDAGLYFSQVKGTEEALLRTQTMYSRTYQRPDADYVTLDSTRTSLGGYGGKFTFGKVGGRFKFAGIFNWKSPGLEINDVGYSPSVDEMLGVIWIGYRWFEPFSIFRSLSVNMNQWNAFDFGWNRNVTGGNVNGHAQFKNFWNTFANVNFEGNVLSNSVLRGGPSMILPGDIGFFTGVFTNNQKKLTFGARGGMRFSNEKDFSSSKSLNLEVGYRPIKTLQVAVSPGYSLSDNKLQYVTQRNYNDDKRYIMAHISRKTLNASIRVNYNITPDLTIQYWGQPFIATGDYTDFKRVTDSKAPDLYDRYSLYTGNQIGLTDNTYEIDENGDGRVDYSFGNPDFNVKEFLSNLVLRWEYRPGSIVYLVWSQNRGSYHGYGDFDFGRDIENLFDEKPYNVFLVKFSYRFGR